MRKLYFFALYLFSISLVPAQIYYTDIANTTGLNTVGNSGDLGGGISFYDFDDDGWDDLTYTQENGQDIIFYKNNNGSFTKMNYNISDTNDSKQIIWVDYDNDGDKDVFIANFNALNRLFNNNGNFVFTEVTLAAGFPNVNKYTYGASWGDYNKDGFLDVFLCSKDLSKTTPNELYKNNGDGTFTNISASAGISNVGHQTFCAAFFDYDNDGDQDIYLANDRAVNTNILYRNNDDGTFTDVSAVSGTNVGLNAMSTTIGDYNQDGWMDIYVTNTPEGNALLSNNGDGTFTDVAIATGTNFNSIAWGAIFYDIENDADTDLYVSGMLDGSSGMLPSALYVNQGNNNFLIPNNVGLNNDDASSFSNACGDVNNDGYMDIAVVNQSLRNTFLWQYSGSTLNNWLKIKLQGTTSNKDGIGSKIEVFANGKSQYRYTLCGEGYLGQNSNFELFGLKDATTIDYIKINWLSGVEDILNNIDVNQAITVVENVGVLSIEEYSDNDFNVYPNPSNGIFNIVFNNMSINRVLTIYDTFGRKIKTKKLTGFNTNMNLYDFAPGVYFLKIQSDDNHFLKKLIFKK
jgi:hypothetical protein